MLCKSNSASSTTHALCTMLAARYMAAAAGYCAAAPGAEVHQVLRVLPAWVVLPAHDQRVQAVVASH